MTAPGSVRIVGGSARGRRLRVPAAGTRPTSGRARAALFNRLDTLVELAGSNVLDLFAGSGAIGLEALSRGAATAWFVESDPRAAAVLAANLTVVGAAGSGVIVRRPVASFLAGARQPTAPKFDIAFADPPYALGEDELADLLRHLVDPRWTAAGAIVVVERASRAGMPRWPDRVTDLASKRYGEGTLWYGRMD